MMEASTIAAILLGSVAGDTGRLAFNGRIRVCALVYAIAVIANLFIPRLAAARSGASWRPRAMTGSFFTACRLLWQDSETRFSLAGTSLFWGPV